MMNRPSRVASSHPFITCSSCDGQIPMHLLAEHVCSTVTSLPMVEEPEQFAMPMEETTLIQPGAARTLKPFVPRIDPYAASRMNIPGEWTPASSGPGSTAASPISPGTGRRSPYLLPPEKASAPAPRRPPSPELLSQDCAFPPFPTSKQKKREHQRPNVRNRTQTSDTPGTSTLAQEWMRSASVGVHSRMRQGTGDSSRPSTANGSRHPSVSSRSESQQGSVDTVPPLPLLHSKTSQPGPDSGAESMNRERYTPFPMQSEPSPLKDSYLEEAMPLVDLASQNSDPPPTAPARARRTSSVYLDHSEPHQNRGGEPRELSYKPNSPPPIADTPPTTFDNIASPYQPPSTTVHPPPTPSSTLTRTLTSLFGRKRGLSLGSKKQFKTAANDGPRLIALTPDPDPPDMPSRDTSAHSSMVTDLGTPPIPDGVQEVPRSSMDVQVTRPVHEIPEPSQAEMGSEDDHHGDDGDDSDIHDHEKAADVQNHETQPQEKEPAFNLQRDTLQLEQDLEKRLAAFGAPRLSVVDEQTDDVKRASFNSASSYGSTGFSHGSTSSRSVNAFEGHSQGSSVSTAMTLHSTEDIGTPPVPKINNPDLVPDSPTDPFYQHGRLAPVTGMLSPHSLEKDEHTDGYFQRNKMLAPVPEVRYSPETEKENSITQPIILAPPTPNSDTEKFDFPSHPRQRRPSTPGACRGVCRGCSKRILSGQKSVSSKDGRLTGKYHRECFACVTCKEPFATADFYVHEDHPYCAQHYHELNGTLCESCGRGIEGHYLETSNVSGHGPKKFHPDCLRCATCKIKLQDDYFELGGNVYCEKDAFRVGNGQRSPYGTAPSRPSPLTESTSQAQHIKKPSQPADSQKGDSRNL